jgi:hypothetical protein
MGAMDSRETIHWVTVTSPTGLMISPPVEEHADLTGHSGAYQLTEEGWSCAVCEAIAAGENLFRFPESGRPPSGRFETWARLGYVWSGPLRREGS